MLAQHPAKSRFGNRVSTDSQQETTALPERSRKSAVMNTAVLDDSVETTYGGDNRDPKFNVRNLPGVSAPLGFFDPLGFSTDASQGRVRFYREVELKHGRLAMLAALGILVAEQFHPMWGGNINVPAYVAFKETPLQTYWGATILAIAIPEIFTIATFKSPFGEEGETWAIRSDYEPGSLGFDPLGLKPEDTMELREMQTKELNNGRLAMLAAAGMIAQELVTGKKLF
jgi:hypothetical protein